MVGPLVSCLMWLLKRTSAYHRPAHLAGAIAFGLLAGIVPKTNLTAVLLYASLLLLPIHSLLGVAISLLATRLMPYTAETSSLLGTILLHQPVLSALWVWIDNAPVLPWLGLHNTLVLGSLVFGFVFLTPTYLISLRVFELLLSYTTVQQLPVAVASPAEVAPTVVLPNEPAPVANDDEEADAELRHLQPASHQLIPAPKWLIRTQPQVIHRGLHSYGLPALIPQDSQQAADRSTALINHWHMSLATDKARSTVKALIGPSSQPDERDNSEDTFTQKSNSDHRQLPSLPMVGFQIDTVPWEESHPMPERTEISNSLDIARNADDILEWVEQALDECLTESRESADQANGDTLPDSVDVSAASDECLAESIEENATRPSMVDDKNASWLLETNIEIVRLVEAPDEKIERSLTSLTASHVDSENSYQSPSDGDEATKMAALITALKYDNHTTTNNEITAVTHTVPNTNSALPNETTNLGSQSQNPVPLAEAGNKPECLGYLLGHLRQLREGTSS